MEKFVQAKIFREMTNKDIQVSIDNALAVLEKRKLEKNDVLYLVCILEQVTSILREKAHELLLL